MILWHAYNLIKGRVKVRVRVMLRIRVRVSVRNLSVWNFNNI